MAYYELEFRSPHAESASFVCVHSLHQPSPAEITMGCVNLVAGYGAPCISVKRISRKIALSTYDEITEYVGATNLTVCDEFLDDIRYLIKTEIQKKYPAAKLIYTDTGIAISTEDAQFIVTAEKC